jgi:hypothetical protein
LAESLNHLASQLQTRTIANYYDCRCSSWTEDTSWVHLKVIWRPWYSEYGNQHINVLESWHEEIDRLNLLVGDLEQLAEMESYSL